MDHLFFHCVDSKNFYFEVRSWLSAGAGIHLPPLELQIVLFGVEKDFPNAQIVNFVLLLYKLVLYNVRKLARQPTLNHFKTTLKKYEQIEYRVAKNQNKHYQHIEKWGQLLHLFEIAQNEIT